LLYIVGLQHLRLWHSFAGDKWHSIVTHLVTKHFSLQLHNGLLQFTAPWEGNRGPLKALVAKTAAVTGLAREIHFLPLLVPMASSILLTKAELQLEQVMIEFISVTRQFEV
jgi:hypothetical protein